MSSPMIGTPASSKRFAQAVVAADEHRDAIDEGDAAPRARIRRRIRSLSGADRKIVDHHVGLGVAQHVDHVVVRRLALAVGEHEGALVGEFGHVLGDAVEHAAHPDVGAGSAGHGRRRSRAIGRAKIASATSRADLAPVDVPGGDDLEVLGPVAAEVPVRQADLLVGAAVRIMRDALDQRAGAIADADDGDIDVGAFGIVKAHSAATLMLRTRGRVALDHPPAEIGEHRRVVWRAGVVRLDAEMVGREAEGDGGVERLERFHLPVEPVLPAVAVAVPPAKPGAQVGDAELLHPAHRVVEAVVVPVEPLHDAHLRRVFAEVVERELGRPVFPDQPHVEMAVIGRALRLLVAGRRLPGARQVEQRVPEDARHPAEQQLGGAVDAELLDFLGAEAADADLGDPDLLVRDHRLDLGDLAPAIRRSATGSSRAESRARATTSTCVEHAVSLHPLDPERVDRRHAAEHALHLRIDRADRLAGLDRHVGEHRPFGVDLGVPMRLVVGLVPDHRRFDHRRPPAPDRRRPGRTSRKAARRSGRDRLPPRCAVDREPGGAQHRLGAGAVGHPPVGPVVRILLLDEVQLGEAGFRRRCRSPRTRNRPRASSTCLEPRCIDWNSSMSRGDMLADEVEREQRMAQMVEHAHEDHEVELLAERADVVDVELARTRCRHSRALSAASRACAR